MEILDPNLLVRNIDGDPDLLAEIVRLFFETSDESLEAIRGAVRDRSATALEESAHRLKGALANVGATAATEAAHRLEIHGREARGGDVDEAVSTLERELRRLEPALRDLVRSHGG